MKLFITGASGYIGFNAAKAMRRAGYSVYGLVRNKQKTNVLASAEIYPGLGDMADPSSCREVVESCSILIHRASDNRNETVELDKKTVKTLIETDSKGIQPRTFIGPRPRV